MTPGNELNSISTFCSLSAHTTSFKFSAIQRQLLAHLAHREVCSLLPKNCKNSPRRMQERRGTLGGADTTMKFRGELGGGGATAGVGNTGVMVDDRRRRMPFIQFRRKCIFSHRQRTANSILEAINYFKRETLSNNKYISATDPRFFRLR